MTLLRKEATDPPALKQETQSNHDVTILTCGQLTAEVVSPQNPNAPMGLYLELPPTDINTHTLQPALDQILNAVTQTAKTSRHRRIQVGFAKTTAAFNTYHLALINQQFQPQLSPKPLLYLYTKQIS